jgi:hypothetical protein
MLVRGGQVAPGNVAPIFFERIRGSDERGAGASGDRQDRAGNAARAASIKIGRIDTGCPNTAQSGGRPSEIAAMRADLAALG